MSDVAMLETSLGASSCPGWLSTVAHALVCIMPCLAALDLLVPEGKPRRSQACSIAGKDFERVGVGTELPV